MGDAVITYHHDRIARHDGLLVMELQIGDRALAGYLCLLAVYYVILY